MQGQVEGMNRNLFDILIQKKIQLGSPQVSDYLRCIQNSMTVKNYTETAVMLEQALAIWPGNEELLILKIQYLADLERDEDMQAFLDELEQKNVYLSSKAKEVIAFWRE